jgi:hypothetical protein
MMKKITLMLLVAMLPFLTMAQKRSKKGKEKTEKIDNSNASYEFMTITGYEMIEEGQGEKGGEINSAQMQVKKMIKSGGKKMILSFDFGIRSQANSELMRNARSYKTMASAVNALANEGWEFVNANVVNLGTTKAHYYYMKRSK